MTREERLELLKQIEKDIHTCSLVSTLLEDAKSCAIHSAIEELEQEPVVDKIRAEIEGMYRVILKGTPENDWAVKWNDCLDEVLQIIDKYKESEE